MKNRQFIFKSAVKAHDCLISQRNLRNQYDCLPPLTEHMGNQFHIHFSLTASGYSLDQTRSWILLLPFFQNACKHFLLLPCEDVRSTATAASVCPQRIPVHFPG